MTIVSIRETHTPMPNLLYGFWGHIDGETKYLLLFKEMFLYICLNADV